MAPPPPERSGRRLAADGLVVALLALAAIPAYLALGFAWRPTAIRLGCTLLVVAGGVRLRRSVVRSMEGQSLSPLDASPPPAPPPELDARYLRLREDLILSTRSRRYFDAILWPRLLELAGGRLAPPARRRWLPRWGVSPRALATLISNTEKVS